MKKCIYTGLPTNKNFGIFPVHERILELARKLRDKGHGTVRDCLKRASEMFIEELKSRK